MAKQYHHLSAAGAGKRLRAVAVRLENRAVNLLPGNAGAVWVVLDKRHISPARSQ